MNASKQTNDRPRVTLGDIWNEIVVDKNLYKSIRRESARVKEAEAKHVEASH